MVSMFHACSSELEFHLALRSCETQPCYVRPVLRFSLCGSECVTAIIFRKRKWKLYLHNNCCMSDIQDLRVLTCSYLKTSSGSGGSLGRKTRAWLLSESLAYVHCAFSSCPRARQCRDPVKPQPLNFAVIREAFWINSPVMGIPLKCLFVWKKNPFIIGEWQSRGSDTVAEGYLDVWAPLTPARKMKSQRDDGSAASIQC